MLVDVMVGLHAEELGGDELAVLGIPLRQCEFGGVVGERAAGVLVQADGDTDVVLAQPDGVGGLLDGADAAVAQALNTLVNVMPVRPTRRVTASGLDTS